jgi:hypothetical protein
MDRALSKAAMLNTQTNKDSNTMQHQKGSSGMRPKKTYQSNSDRPTYPSLRAKSVKARAHSIALEIYGVTKPFLDRDEAIPRGLLEETFLDACYASTDLRGGPLTDDEMESLAATLIPTALADLRRDIVRADGLLMRSIGVVDEILRAAA